MTVIDTESYKVIASLPVKAPYGFAISNDGEQFFVTSQAENKLVVFDANTLEATARIATGKMPESVALSVDNQRAFVVNWFSNSISVIDLQTKQQSSLVKLNNESRMIVKAQ